MSKSYSLAGARLGLAFAAPELIAQLLKIKDSYNVNALTQIAACTALKDQGYLRQLVPASLNSDRSCRTAANAGLSCVPTAANFILVDIGEQAATLRPTWPNMATWCATGRSRLRRYLRITVGTPAAMTAVLKLLAQWQQTST